MVLGVVLATSAAVPALAANKLTFSDVPENMWCYDSVMAMTEKGLFAGTTTPVNGVALFSPDDNMTRAQFITVLVRYLFPDAEMTAGQYWYSPYETAARQNGLISSGDFTDTLDIPCSREEMAYLLTNALTILGEDLNAVDSSYIPDFFSISPLYQDAVKVAVSLGLITGMDDAHTFFPKDSMIRAQAVAVVHRLVDPSVRVSNASNPSPDTTQTQNPETIGSNSNPEANIDAPESPEASNPTQENSDTSKDDPYGPVVRESISFLDAGCYVDDATLAAAGIRPRPTLDKNDDVNAAVDKLNGFVFDTYGRRYLQRGIGLNHNAGQQIAMIVKDGDTWGMRVFGWRKSYDSDAALNAGLNVALEGMRYLSGDKEVASALWRLVDYMYVHHTEIPNSMIESYGFTVSNETSNSIDISMNGCTVHWTWNDAGTEDYFYFN